MHRSSRFTAAWLIVIAGSGTGWLRGDESIEERLQAIEAKLDRALREIEALRGRSAGEPPGEEEVLYQGRTVASWIRDLGDRDEKVQGAAISALWKLGADALPALFAALEAKDWVARQNATVVVARLAGKAGRAGAEALVRKSKDPHEAVRKALGAWRASPEEGVPVLIAALRDESPFARATAARVLGGTAARPAWPEGREGAAAPPPPDVKSAVPSLTEALKDADAAVRLEAARTLGILGPEAREAVPALAVLVADPEPSVSFEAACALAYAGPPAEAGPALARLRKSLADPDEANSLRAARAIARFGTAARDLAPELFPLFQLAQGALGPPREFDRHWYIVALSAVDPKCEEAPAEEVVAALVEAMVHGRDENLRLEAIAGLGRLGPLAAAAQDQLAELLDPQGARARPRPIRTGRVPPGVRREPVSAEVREKAAAALARIRGE